MWSTALALLTVTAPLRFEWVAPSPCHDEARARQEIERLLGRSLAATEPEVERVHAELSATPAGWSLNLTVGGPTEAGARMLEAATCEELSAAAELIIAMAIDPDAVARASGAAPTVTQPAPAAAPPAAAREASALSVGLNAALAVEAGVLPGPGLGVALGAGVVFRDLLARLAVSYSPPRQSPGARPGTGVDLWLIDAQLRLGWLALRGPVALELDVGADGGALHGVGVGYDLVSGGFAPWVAVCAAVSLGLAIARHLAVRVFVEVGASVLAPGFATLSGEVVYQPGPLYGRLGLAFEIPVG